jgi:hypothetical protein
MYQRYIETCRVGKVRPTGPKPVHPGLKLLQFAIHVNMENIFAHLSHWSQSYLSTSAALAAPVSLHSM